VDVRTGNANSVRNSASANGLAVSFLVSASLTRHRLQFSLVLYVVAIVIHDFLFSDSRPLVVTGCCVLMLCIINFF
jgi:hypothetical protein